MMDIQHILPKLASQIDHIDSKQYLSKFSNN